MNNPFIQKIIDYVYIPGPISIVCPACHGAAALPGSDPCYLCGRAGIVDENKVKSMEVIDDAN